MKRKVSITQDQLREHLAEQVQFLEVSAAAYDEGFDGEAKRLAVTIRVLLHDTAKSQSLLGQLKRKGARFLTTAIPVEPANQDTHSGLVMMALKGRQSRYVAMLDEAMYMGWLPFDEWWHQPIFVDDRKETLSRKDLVLTAANQDGGGHVDPGLEETYARLSKQNSLGWRWVEGDESTPIDKAERAAIRQIAHEVLRTLVPEYARKPCHKADLIVGGITLTQGFVPPPIPRPRQVGRNEACPCGSGKKYKKCHGTRMA